MIMYLSIILIFRFFPPLTHFIILGFILFTFRKLWISTYLLEEGPPTNKQCKWNIIFS